MSVRLIVDLFHVLYCSGSMCVGVTVWFGWGGVVSLCRLCVLVLRCGSAGWCGILMQAEALLLFMHDFCLFGICESQVYWTVHHLDS